MDAADVPADRPAFRLTKDMVLSIFAKSETIHTCDANDAVQMMHHDHIHAGGKGFPPRGSLVKSRLDALAREGLIECNRWVEGPYGYRWTLTAVGREALVQIEATKRVCENAN